MSFGAALGMKFIDKGIDQFTFGVGQEYNRYAREKARKWQVQDMQSALTWRVRDGQRVGIHPLAAIGANVGGSSPIVGGSVQPPYGSNPMPPIQSKEEKRILDANARKAEAEASLLEKEVEQMGQAPKYGVSPSGSIGPDGQPDGDIYPAGSANLANAGAVENIQKYGVTRDGYIYATPTQSYQEAFGEEGTLMNRFLYNMREAWFPKKVNDLKNNWNSPDKDLQSFKYYFLQSRPRSNDPKEVILWDGVGWRAYPRHIYGDRHIFKSGPPIMKPRKKKRRMRNDNSQDWVAP